MQFFRRSFIVFLPELKEANLPFMSRVEESHFKRKLVVVPGMVHEYRHGYQHVLPKYVFYIRHFKIQVHIFNLKMMNSQRFFHFLCNFFRIFHLIF